MAGLTVQNRAAVAAPSGGGGGGDPGEWPFPDDDDAEEEQPNWIETVGPAEGLDVLDGRPVRVLIVDDDPLVRSGLSMMLEAFYEIEVVGAIGDGREVMAAVNSFRPDVVLMDIRMPGIDGLTATAALRARREAPEVIVLTTFDTDEHVRRAIQAGASGFLLKHTPPAGIARAVCRAAVGEPIFTPSVLRQVMGLAAASDHNPARERARAALGRLTPSETDVARLIADGRTNQEIAAGLLVSTGTVKAYVTRIFAKLQVTNRVQVAILVHESR